MTWGKGHKMKVTFGRVYFLQIFTLSPAVIVRHFPHLLKWLYFQVLIFSLYDLESRLHSDLCLSSEAHCQLPRLYKFFTFQNNSLLPLHSLYLSIYSLVLVNFILVVFEVIIEINAYIFHHNCKNPRCFTHFFFLKPSQYFGTQQVINKILVKPLNQMN